MGKNGQEHESIVTTALGDLRGIERDGVRIFRGIRYAKPPTGDMRFRPPVPAEAWSGVADATTFGPVSFQPYDPSVDHGTQDMSEDCLSLNIWAPAHPGPHPVLFWIHGGGQTVGSTRRVEYEGSRFATNGVVCVTVGYRLGALGFLELGEILGPEYRGSGNNAIRDLLMALQWVSRHISAFGGNPTRVTLGGESAGAKNAVTLIGVPEARGLFHRAVVCSGGAHTIHHLRQAEAVARLLCKEAGLREHEGKRLLEIPVADLLVSQASTMRYWTSKFPFRPVVDGSFIPAPLITQIETGTCKTLPVLIGTSRDECAIFIDGSNVGSDLVASELAHVSPKEFTAVENGYADLLPQHSRFERRVRAMTAAEYWIPSIRLAEALSARGAAVWMYRFDGVTGDVNHVLATHVSDLPLWWGHRNGTLNASPATPAATAEVMHAALTSFTCGENLDQGNDAITWHRYDILRRAVLTYGLSAEVKFDLDGAERAMWESVL